MADLPRVGDLEIDQDLEHEERAWKFRRIGWILMALIVFAGLAGLLGSGPLSHASAGGPESPLRVEYPRFARFTAPAYLEIHLSPSAAAGREARVWIDRDYLQDMQIEDVVPEPERVESAGDRLVFVMPLAEPGRSTAIELHLQAQRIGSLEGRVGVEGGSSLQFQQLIYP